MKSYDVKYELDQEVYVFLNKKVISTKIEKIQIVQGKSYTYLSSDNSKQVELSGIEISYLVPVEMEVPPYNGMQTGVSMWYNQEDICTTKEEVISKILD